MSDRSLGGTTNLTMNGSPLPSDRLDPERRHRVLLVEDDASIADLVSMVLDAYGYDTDVAPTGATAIARLDTLSAIYAVVLLDLGLPDMGGSEVLQHAREVRPTLPIIVSSGGSTPIPTGAAGRLAKPYRAEDLLACVRACLRPHA